MADEVHDTVEETCLVYQVVEKEVKAWRDPAAGNWEYTGVAFRPGELVSVDMLLLHSSNDNTTGPFLRLSDGSGWLCQKEAGLLCLREMPVESGLWVFYVDNIPDGHALYRHPVIREDMQTKTSWGDCVTFQTMQKVHCDRKVAHIGINVTFYRIKGTGGWVFDRNNNAYGHFMLLDETHVETGLFAFRCLQETCVWKDGCNKNNATKWFRKDEIVAVDLIRLSPVWHGTGPFLRLADGSGWLVKERDNKRLLEEQGVDAGSWKLENVYGGDPWTWTEPRERGTRSSRRIEKNECILCDCRTASSSVNASWYRIQGTSEWVVDRWISSGKRLFEVESLELAHRGTTSASRGCGPDSVRAIAATVDNLEETDCDYKSKVISFRSKDGALIHVDFATSVLATYTVSLGGPRRGHCANCNADELREILKNPQTIAGHDFGMSHAAGPPSAPERPIRVESSILAEKSATLVQGALEKREENLGDEQATLGG